LEVGVSQYTNLHELILNFSTNIGVGASSASHFVLSVIDVKREFFEFLPVAACCTHPLDLAKVFV